MPSTYLRTQATQESQGEQGRSDGAHARREDPYGGSEARASPPDHRRGRTMADQPLRGVSTMDRMRGVITAGGDRRIFLESPRSNMKMKTSGGQNLWTHMGIKGSGAAGSGHIWGSQVVGPQVLDTYGDRRLWGHRLWTHMGIKTSGGQNLWGAKPLCAPSS